jgi:hypothetical protein
MGNAVKKVANSTICLTIGVTEGGNDLTPKKLDKREALHPNKAIFQVLC